MNKDYVVVIGGSNIDYIAHTKSKLIPKDSNVGDLRISFGGVGRNIVENLARLSVPTYFISAIGNDANGKRLIKELKDLNVNVINTNAKMNSSSYTAILNNKGDMEVAVCDNKIISTLDIKFIDKYDDIIRNAKYIVLEVNLDENVIEYIVDKYQDKKIIVDGISTTKVHKIKNVIDKLYLLKVNQYEYKEIVKYKKPLNTVITKGSKPLVLLNKTKKEFDVKPIEKIVNATGAGDSLLAGIVYGFFNSFTLDKSIKFGIKCSYLTLDYDGSVNPLINKLIK